MILWTTWVYALRPKLTSLREMSAAHNREDLATIGDHAAGQQVQYDHFAATFELNGWNFGEHIKKPRQYCRGALRYLQWVRRSTHLLSDAIADYFDLGSSMLSTKASWAMAFGCLVDWGKRRSYTATRQSLGQNPAIIER